MRGTDRKPCQHLGKKIDCCKHYCGLHTEPRNPAVSAAENARRKIRHCIQEVSRFVRYRREVPEAHREAFDVVTLCCASCGDYQRRNHD